MKLLPKVGERIAATFWTAVSEAPDPIAAFLALDLKKAPAGARQGLSGFVRTMKALRGASYQASPAEAIRYVVDEGGYTELARAKFTNSNARLDDLEALAQFALPYDEVGRFLQEVTLFGDPAGEETVAGEKDDERVILSSVHQAKGLEWRAVFLIGLAEDRFPNARAIRTPEGLEEERRLFHVAVTRAKDELTLVHPLSAFDRTGILVMTEPSRFLRELPGDLYERWVLETPSGAVPSLPEVAGVTRVVSVASEDDPTLEAGDEGDGPVN